MSKDGVTDLSQAPTGMETSHELRAIRQPDESFGIFVGDELIGRATDMNDASRLLMLIRDGIDAHQRVHTEAPVSANFGQDGQIIYATTQASALPKLAAVSHWIASHNKRLVKTEGL